jgi:hypothetical protein
MMMSDPCRPSLPTLPPTLPGCLLQDPGNLESDLQVGAHAGYKLLWVLLWSTVLVSRGAAVCNARRTLLCYSCGWGRQQVDMSQAAAA